jgi:hypothetical protein
MQMARVQTMACFVMIQQQTWILSMTLLIFLS